MNRALRFWCGFGLFLFFSIGYTSPSFAQPLIGLELGAGQHTQQGTFTCDCGSTFTDGTGTGFLGSAFFELPLSRDFSAGLKIGLDFKNISSTESVNEFVLIMPSGQSKPEMDSLLLNRNATIKLTFLRSVPYIQYQLFHSDAFVQAGLGISYLRSSNVTQTRTMTTTSITLSDGTIINGLTFTNGSRTETIENESIPNAQTLLFSGIVSAGYNVNFGSITLAPILTYEYPFSTVQPNTNWKISSLYGSIAIKYKLD